MAYEILECLNSLKEAKINKISEKFYMNLIDSFDIYSDFWKKFRIFQDSNPDLFE